MTTQPYLGAALCYDASHLNLYEEACLTINPEGNAWSTNKREFDCTGILMHNFYLALVDGGETEQCVCKFVNTGSSWAFQTHWGPCNGACVGEYRCDGARPVSLTVGGEAGAAGAHVDTGVDLDEVGKRSWNAANGTSSATASSPSASTAAKTMSETSWNWKAVILCVVTMLLFNPIV